MTEFIARYRMAILSIGVIALYWLSIIVFPPAVMLEVLDGITLALSVLLLAIYLPLAHLEMKTRRLDRTGRLVVGIALAWTATLLLRGLAIYGRTFGRASDFIESVFFPFIIYALVWAAILHITAPYADDYPPRVPFGKWIVVCLVAGGLVAGFFLGVQYGLWLEKAHNPPMTG